VRPVYRSAQARGAAKPSHERARPSQSICCPGTFAATSFRLVSGEAIAPAASEWQQRRACCGRSSARL